MPAARRTCLPLSTLWRGCAGLVIAATAWADESTPKPPLKFDVAAAERAAQASAAASDSVTLAPVIVHGQRSRAEALPCIGCDGRVLVPMHRLQDFSDVIGSMLTMHPPARPDSPEDRALALAHESSCVDGFSCLLPK